AVFEGRYSRPTGGRNFCDFVEQVYKPWARENKRSWKNEAYCVPMITAYFKGKTFAQISPLLIEKFKKHLRDAKTKADQPYSPRYVNYYLEKLGSIFTLATKEREIAVEDNPCRRVAKLKLDNKRDRYLLDEEEPELFKQLVEPRAHLRPLVIVAIGTGMRLGDELNLRKRRVDLQRNVINVPNSKTGKDYPVPMNPDVRAVMLKLMREHPESEFVFTNPKTGKPYTGIKRAFE